MTTHPQARLTPLTTCAKTYRTVADCLGALAGGWITASDLCGPCTGRFMAALDTASPEPLNWHPAYRARAAGGAQ